VGNKELKTVYDTMHKKGATAWFSDGHEERETILKMGEPWNNKLVLEIGCGEGDLVNMLHPTVKIVGIDYYKEAIKRGRDKNPYIPIYNQEYKTVTQKFDRIVMQGVLEHLDDPFTELKWMMDNLLTEHGDVITSSPCFLNPRGIVWMTLDMLGAVMSKTDLHFINPGSLEIFCQKHGYDIKMQSCDFDWAGGDAMIEDLKQRIPLALRDGNIKYDNEKLDRLMLWLSNFRDFIKPAIGATMVYRISKP